MRLRVALALVGLIAPAVLAAQPQLVADLGTVAEGRAQGLFLGINPVPVLAGGRTYFVHNDGLHGFELWSTDGTAAATAMVADVCPGACSGIPDLQPETLAAMGSRVYFEADDGITGVELWETDGTAAGTRRVADLAPSPGADIDPKWLTPFGDRLLFVGRAGGSTCSLFSLLAGEPDPDLVADFPCATYDDAPGDFTPLGDVLLFSAMTASDGRELWVTDGTALGTALVLDVAPGPPSGLGGGGVEWMPATRWLSDGTRIFFRADDGVHGAELWTSDGTAAGTAMLVDLETGSAAADPRDFLLFGGDLLFVAGTTATGSEVWRLPIAGPPLPEALEVTAGPNGASPTFLGATSAAAFFAASRSDVGYELFATDGTTAGTHLVADVAAGSSGLISGASRTSSFVEDDRLFFVGEDHRGAELWRSDGTAAGTGIVADVNLGAADFFPFAWFLPVAAAGLLPDGGHLVAGSQPLHGHEPWVTDGAGGFSLLADLDQQSSVVSCFPRLCTTFAADGARLAFPAVDWTSGRQAIAWADGTAQAHLVQPSGLSGQWVIRWPAFGLDLGTWANGRLFFAAGIDNSNDLVWMSDGTAAGTRPLHDVAPTVPHDLPVGMTSRFGRAYVAFDEYDGGDGIQSLWFTDGTATGTGTVGAFLLAVRDPHAPVQSFLLLSRSDDEYTLWQLDGPNGPPHALTTLEGEFWSVAAEIPHGTGGERVLLLVETQPYWPWQGQRRLWAWRESTGLVLLSESFAPVAGNWDYEVDLRPPVALLGEHVAFAAADAGHGAEPWITDGTPAGTHMLADVYPGPLGSQPRWFAVSGSQVFFSAYEPASGREIWRSDGATTALALDLVVGAESSRPTYLTPVEGELYFAARAPSAGVELVAWNPQLPAPAAIHDVYAGAESSSPTHLTWMSGQLYFLANDGTHGLELWRLAAGSRLFADDFETGGVARWSAATHP